MTEELIDTSEIAWIRDRIEKNRCYPSIKAKILNFEASFVNMSL